MGQFRQRRNELRKAELTNCPKAGCHAHDLAVGTLQEIQEKANAIFTPSILDITTDLIGDQRDQINGDWECGRDKAATILEMRNSYWQVIPHKGCAVCGLDEPIARAHMAEGLRQYLSAPDDHKHHPFSDMVFHPGNIVGAQTRLWISGEIPRKQLPTLLAMSRRVRGIKCVERSVEAIHRYNKFETLLANRAGPAYRSFKLRIPEALEMVKTQPELLNQGKK